jgi:hypothetical protein
MKNSEKEELIDSIIWIALLKGNNPKFKLPGSIISSLSEVTRNKLKELTSDDFNHRVKEII